MKFQEKLEILIKRDGLNNRKLGNLLEPYLDRKKGASDSTVRRWREKGYDPNLSQLQALAAVFKLPVCYLADDSIEALPDVDADHPVVLTAVEAEMVSLLRAVPPNVATELVGAVRRLGVDGVMDRIMGKDSGSTVEESRRRPFRVDPDAGDGRELPGS